MELLCRRLPLFEDCKGNHVMQVQLKVFDVIAIDLRNKYLNVHFVTKKMNHDWHHLYLIFYGKINFSAYEFRII